MESSKIARIQVGGDGVQVEYRASFPHIEARALRHGAVIANWGDLPPSEVLFHIYGLTPIGKWLLNTLEWRPTAYAHQFGPMNDAVSLNEAAKRMNLSAQALYAARRRHQGTFPTSCTRSANASLYRFREIEDWYRRQASK